MTWEEAEDGVGEGGTDEEEGKGEGECDDCDEADGVFSSCDVSMVGARIRVTLQPSLRSVCGRTYTTCCPLRSDTASSSTSSASSAASSRTPTQSPALPSRCECEMTVPFLPVSATPLVLSSTSLRAVSASTISTFMP